MYKLMSILIFCFLITIGVVPSLYASFPYPWNIETIDSKDELVGFYSTLTLDSYDRPHIAYISIDLIDSRLKYCYNHEGSWIIQTIKKDMDFNYVSMDLDSNNNPHIVYGHGYHPEPLQLGYVYLDEGVWHHRSINDTGNVGYGISLILDSDDHPHISYMDGNNAYLKYGFYDGDSWHINIVDDTGNVSTQTSLAVNSYDTPHICYSYWNSNVLWYAYLVDDDWFFEKKCDNCNIANDLSLELDSNDNAHVCYSNTNDELMYSYRWDYGWIDTRIETDDSAYYGISMVLDSMDNPHICYSNSNHDLKYVYYENTQYHTETIEHNVTYSYSDISLELDSADHPHVSYCNNLNPFVDFKVNYAKKYGIIIDEIKSGFYINITVKVTNNIKSSVYDIPWSIKLSDVGFGNRIFLGNYSQGTIDLLESRDSVLIHSSILLGYGLIYIDVNVGSESMQFSGFLIGSFLFVFK